MRWKSLVLALAASLGVAGANAQVAAGLIVEASGSISPTLQPLTEVEPGFEAALSPGATVAFVHYRSCTQLTVEGGTISMKLTSFFVDGTVRSQKKSCPKRYVLSRGDDTVAAGLVMRGVQASVATRPIVLLIGSGVPAIVKAEIRSGNALVSDLLIAGRTIALPENAPGLAPGGEYALVLHTQSGKPFVKELRVAAAGQEPEDRRLILKLE